MHILGMSRRRLLGSAAASSLAFLPFTRSLVSEAKAASGPQVLLTLYHPFGVVENAFYPTGPETLSVFPDGSRPLQDIKGDVLMFRNLDNLAGENAKCASGHDQHVAGVQTVWTGGPLKYAGGGAIRSLPTMPSIDQVVGEHLKLRHKTRFAAYNFGMRTLATDIGFTNTDVSGQVKKINNDPLGAYMDLFGGGVTKPISMDDAARRMMLRRSLLDDVVADAKRFESALGGSEKAAFGAHMTALRTFETNLSTFGNEAVPTMSCKDIPDKTKFAIAAGSDDIFKTADIEAQLMVLALSCGITNVATLNLTSGFGSSYRVPKVVNAVGEGPFDGHGLSHDEVPNSREVKINFNHMQAKTFVNMANLLKTTASPRGGTLFDEAIMLWSSCLSGRFGGGHTRVKIPFVVAAGKNSGFSTGRIIDAGGRSQNQILLSTCQSFGMNVQSFGDKTFCPGPMTAMTTPGPMPAYARPAGGYGCQGV